MMSISNSFAIFSAFFALAAFFPVFCISSPLPFDLFAYRPRFQRLSASDSFFTTKSRGKMHEEDRDTENFTNSIYFLQVDSTT